MANKEIVRKSRADASRSISRTGSLHDVLPMGPGWYWISPTSREISPGRYEGVPSVHGYFIANKDGTFTKLGSKEDAPSMERIYVSPAAAKIASKGRGPLAVLVKAKDSLYARIEVYPDTGLRMPLRAVPKSGTQQLKDSARE